MLDDLDRDLMRSVAAYLTRASEFAAKEQTATVTPIGRLAAEHLGQDPASLPIVSEQIADHRLVDTDIAFEHLAEVGDRLLGIGGGDTRFHSSLSEFLANPHVPWDIGAVSYAARATGPASTRQVVSFGLRLLHSGGQPLVVLQRAANHQYGRVSAELEIIGADPEAVTAFIERFRAAMIEHSVLRGQVLSFVPTQYGAGAGATFLKRPDVGSDDIVLAEGTLDEVVRHVVGIGEHRDVLRAAGQHLKRGILLYGPPGTGKTLTIRHLLQATPEVTAVLLTGSSISAIGAATEIARTFQPSIVVLEDIDLVAMERHSSPQPLLFEVLDALDGLDGDADVAFVMTTNRVEVLERALADRPGRVDLAVEIPLPGPDERRRLFERYASGLGLSLAALALAAATAEHTTGSFAKELIRRTVLLAASRGSDPADEDLAAALDSLLAARSALTRKLLGSRTHGDDSDAGAAAEGEETTSFGWFSYSPLAGDPRHGGSPALD
ncbi:MAG: ATP-binding protein [Naasia sp.]